LEQIDRLLAGEELRELGRRDRSRGESAAVGTTLAREHRDVRPRRHDVRQQAMALVDDVVVVRNVAVVGVLELGAARGHPTGEPGGVELELEVVALRSERLDVPEEHELLWAARLSGGDTRRRGCGRCGPE